VESRRRALMARIRAGEATDAEIAEHLALKRAAAGLATASPPEGRPGA